MNGIRRSLIRLAMLAAIGSAVAVHGAVAPAAPEPSAPPTTAAVDGDGATSLAKLAWLAGCWERRSDTRVIEEQWMTPRGGLMLGMARTVDGERTREYEQTSIRIEGAELVFTARPSGQVEASFRSTEIGARRVVFENLAHDFPQRVIYALDDSGQLAARIEGLRQGRVVGVDFPYRRVACPGAPSG
jgi:hypothetical protein